MKSFITIALIVVASAVVMCLDPDPELRKQIDECIKEHNVSPKDFNDYIKGKLATISENIKCTSHCIFMKQGCMDETGTFKPDVAKAKMGNDDEFNSIVDECKNLSGSSPCDTASKISQCILSHN